jgi:hypothetical protein
VDSTNFTDLILLQKIKMRAFDREAVCFSSDRIFPMKVSSFFGFLCSAGWRMGHGWWWWRRSVVGVEMTQPRHAAAGKQAGTRIHQLNSVRA